jgi:hypothetical protein
MTSREYVLHPVNLHTKPSHVNITHILYVNPSREKKAVQHSLSYILNPKRIMNLNHILKPKHIINPKHIMNLKISPTLTIS